MQVNTYIQDVWLCSGRHMLDVQSNLTLTCGMSFHQITAALNYPCVVSPVIGLTILNI